MILTTRLAGLIALAVALGSCSDFTGPAEQSVPEWSHFLLDYHGETRGRLAATGDPVAEPGQFHSYAYADAAAGHTEEPVFVGAFEVRTPEEGRTAAMYLSRGEEGSYDLRQGCLGTADPSRCATLEIMLDWNPSAHWTESTRSSEVFQVEHGVVRVTGVDGGRIRGTVEGVAYAADRAERTLDRTRRIEVRGTFNAPFLR